MSVLNFLTSLASTAVLSQDENNSIAKSISTLQSRLNTYFIQGIIKSQFRFGSSTRGTILPRKMDEQSDIDYMIIFNDNGYQPSTYLGWLKDFAVKCYSTSEIHQSSPAVVLELNHIKFDLVPAVLSWNNEILIPDKSSGWISTNPNDFNQKLENKNIANKSLIKPTIRLMKFWNVQSGYLFESFSLEKWICELNYYLQTNLRDYLFSTFDNLNLSHNYTQKQNDEITRAKQIVQKIRQMYDQNSDAAIREIMRLFRL